MSTSPVEIPEKEYEGELFRRYEQIVIDVMKKSPQPVEVPKEKAA